MRKSSKMPIITCVSAMQGKTFHKGGRARGAHKRPPSQIHLRVEPVPRSAGGIFFSACALDALNCQQNSPGKMRLCLCCLSQHSNSSAGQDVPGSVRPSGTAFRFYFRRRLRLPGVDRTRSRRRRCSRARFRSAPGRLPVGRRGSVSVCFRIRTKRMWLVYTGSWRSVRLI